MKYRIDAEVKSASDGYGFNITKRARRADRHLCVFR